MKKVTFKIYENTWFTHVENYELNYERAFCGYTLKEIKKKVREENNLKAKHGVKFVQVYQVRKEL